MEKLVFLRRIGILKAIEVQTFTLAVLPPFSYSGIAPVFSFLSKKSQAMSVTSLPSMAYSLWNHIHEWLVVMIDLSGLTVHTYGTKNSAR